MLRSNQLSYVAVSKRGAHFGQCSGPCQASGYEDGRSCGGLANRPASRALLALEAVYVEGGMTDVVRSPCSVLLLAGGRGSRMGGRDKGLIEWQERPMIAWLHDSVRQLTDDLIISCNRNHERYGAYADQLVQDGDEAFEGPLAGVRAGLAAMRHDYLLVLPCDAPMMDAALPQALLAQAQAHPGRPVMVQRGAQWEPLFSCLPVSLAEAIETAWQNGERSPRRLLLQLSAVALNCDEADPRLANLNTPELLADAKG
jgi:molybdopterin-guanine dinucleotide biosynthesis protein A